MAINFRSNTIIKNLRVGPLSGGGNGGGGGGSSEPSYLAVGAPGVNTATGAAYVFDATDYTATPTFLAPSGLDLVDRFGYSIAATSNHVVVGAYEDDDYGSTAGAAYVFDAANLSATPTKLTPSGLGSNDRFGKAVAASSNYILIGAALDDSNPLGGNEGAVYVYDANNLSATPTKLVPSGISSSDFFGSSVAIYGNQIVIGAIYDDDQGSQAGAVYVYDASNLSATPTKLTPAGLGADDEFGGSVAVSSNQIVVTSKDDDQGSNAGAVYVFDATNLSATPTKLAPSGLGNYDSFGYSVAATSNQVVVGTPYDDDQGENAGAVYVYDATNLSATPTKLTPSGLGISDQFGHSVTAHGSQIIVGAPQDDDEGSNAGAIYIYDANDLSATPTKLTPSSLGSSYAFGQSVSLG